MSDRNRTLTIYRDDTTTQWKLKRVKAFFWTANNTVLTVAQWAGDTGKEHSYIHIPREIICWFKDSGSTSVHRSCVTCVFSSYRYGEAECSNENAGTFPPDCGDGLPLWEPSPNCNTSEQEKTND